MKIYFTAPKSAMRHGRFFPPLSETLFSSRSKIARKRLPRFGAALAIGVGTAAIALIVATPARTNGLDFDRRLDRGGRIEEYVRRIVASAGRPHVISGDCMSACTMWLGHKGTCVTPDAVLWFHAASDGLQAMRQENPWRTISPAGNASLLAMYPSRVRAVVRPWLESPDYHTLTGMQLAQLGVPLCRQGAVAERDSD